ncbi:hypothetical protein COTS27_00347 [Spirochaetota bacterium]|nr:hypothetical protein COTS27_00347 [Spirochaetota bacterium]
MDKFLLKIYNYKFPAPQIIPQNLSTTTIKPIYFDCLYEINPHWRTINIQF